MLRKIMKTANENQLHVWQAMLYILTEGSYFTTIRMLVYKLYFPRLEARY